MSRNAWRWSSDGYKVFRDGRLLSGDEVVALIEPLPLEVLVECLTDESGSEYCVSIAMDRAKVRSKWGRSEAKAEKLAATIRDAFGVAPAEAPSSERVRIFEAFDAAAQGIADATTRDNVREFLMRAWHHNVLPALNAGVAPSQASSGAEPTDCVPGGHDLDADNGMCRRCFAAVGVDLGDGGQSNGA